MKTKNPLRSVPELRKILNNPGWFGDWLSSWQFQEYPHFNSELYWANISTFTNCAIIYCQSVREDPQFRWLAKPTSYMRRVLRRHHATGMIFYYNRVINGKKLSSIMKNIVIILHILQRTTSNRYYRCTSLLLGVSVGLWYLKTAKVGLSLFWKTWWSRV